MIAPQSIDELNRTHSAGGAATFAKGKGGLTVVTLRSADAEAQVYLQGAHVAHWQRRGEKPVLWMSGKSWFEPGKPIRGGVPVCLPWFGPHPTDTSAPNHGWARLEVWRVEWVRKHADGSVAIRLSLARDGFAFAHEITVGRSLTMTLEVANTGTVPAPVSEALHTYFNVSDVRKINITGVENVSYLSKSEGGGRYQSDKPVTFTGQTDRVYFGTESTCQLHDPGHNRTIVVSKRGSKSTVIWNPWIERAREMPDFGDDEWPGMVCIESANALDDMLTLAPGAKHVMTQKLDVQPA